jgi:superfamily I DNA and/or RNA helicase
VPADTCKQHDRETENVMNFLHIVPQLQGQLHPLMWLDNNTPCQRNPTTHSLYNIQEAKKAMAVALEIGDQIGDEHILVLATYRAQVQLNIQ